MRALFRDLIELEITEVNSYSERLTETNDPAVCLGDCS